MDWIFRRKTLNSAHYYLMKDGFILRLESPLDPEDIPVLIKYNLLDSEAVVALNQDQANYRVAIFRDEIVEMDEYAQKVLGHNF